MNAPLVLDCATAGYPTPNIIWYLPPDSREIVPGYVDDMYRVLANGSLVIARVGVQHEALFRCSAENLLGVIQGNANVRVIGGLMKYNFF